MKNGGFYLSEKCLVSALSLFINFSNMYTVQYLKTPCKPLIQNDLYYINTCTDLPPPPPPEISNSLHLHIHRHRTPLAIPWLRYLSLEPILEFFSGFVIIPEMVTSTFNYMTVYHRC